MTRLDIVPVLDGKFILETENFKTYSASGKSYSV